jgi:hypothetical protein
MIIANFDLVGISEIGHNHAFPKNAFIPTDPEYALLKTSVINRAQFDDVFWRRIEYCVKRCNQSGKSLLIREHTHSYFFHGSVNTALPKHPSWIADQYLKRKGEKLKCIVTLRDPVDSWLGLLANIPKMAPANFLEYCSRYKDFLASVIENDDRNSLLIVKHEDIVENWITWFERIADFIGMPFDANNPADWAQIPSTGNSGRQFQELTVLPRRPFGTQLIREAEKSDAYQYIIQKLGYRHLCEPLSFKVKLQAHSTDIKRRIALIQLKALSRIQNWANNHSRTP